VEVTTVDEDQQEVIVHEPGPGEIFGLAAMLEQTPHQTNALAVEQSVCLEVSRDDLTVLLERKPPVSTSPMQWPALAARGPSLSRLRSFSPSIPLSIYGSATRPGTPIPSS